jgi:hypothetical protein
MAESFESLQQALCGAEDVALVKVVCTEIFSVLLINRHYAQNPLIGCRSVSDTWNLVNPVRKVEFELLQFVLSPPE